MEPVVFDSSDGKKYQIIIVIGAGGFGVHIYVLEGAPPTEVLLSELPQDVMEEIARLVKAYLEKLKPVAKPIGPLGKMGKMGKKI